MTSIKRAARHLHWLVAVFALALVCVPGRESRADDKSILSALVGGCRYGTIIASGHQRAEIVPIAK